MLLSCLWNICRRRRCFINVVVFLTIRRRNADNLVFVGNIHPRLLSCTRIQPSRLYNLQACNLQGRFVFGAYRLPGNQVRIDG